jgi:hypothetical protein
MPLVLSTLALLFSVATFAVVWTRLGNLRISAPDGGAYIVFVDRNGNFKGSIADDYGGLKITRLDAERLRRVEMKLGDQGASFTLYRSDQPVARWAVTDEGTTFEKNPLPR